MVICSIYNGPPRKLAHYFSISSRELHPHCTPPNGNIIVKGTNDVQDKLTENLGLTSRIIKSTNDITFRKSEKNLSTNGQTDGRTDGPN